MEYRLKTTGEVLQDHEFYAMHPNVTGINPQTCGSFGADPVYPSEPPTPGRYQKLVRDGVELIGSEWKAKYALVAMTAEEMAALDSQKAMSVRNERNAKLAATDWRFRSDMSPSQAWADYCQALRDLTDQEGFPWDLQWPEAPNN